MGLRSRIVEIAVSQLGYTEGNNNDTKYGTWYGLPNQPWCAMFVSWCANEAGISQNIIKKFAYCPTGYNWFKNKKEATRNHILPKEGDIIFFLWSQGGTLPDHVGLVEYVENNTVHTIEGNRSDKVQRYSYNIDDWRIYGYGQPNYGDEPTPQPVTGLVANIQRTLNARYGFGIAVDNIAGNQTKTALIKALQIELNRQYNKGLAVDGIFGPVTKSRCITLRKGDSGNITYILQARLTCLGYTNNGQDGVFGNVTYKEVRQFQKAKGITVDGIVGQQTWGKLFG